MGRWPDFFIVGAARSGTTSLYYYLSGHPDIFMPSVKEPNFFNHIDFDAPDAHTRFSGLKLIRREDDYLKLFSGASSNQVVGEASALYLADKVAPERIKHKNPCAKIIMLLRNPVERAYSQYLLEVRDFRESEDSFYHALLRDQEYMSRDSDSGGTYIWPGLYSQHVQRYLEVFGREQVRVFLADDLASDTTGVVEDLCYFLGLPFYNGSFFDPDKKYHGYGAPKNALLDWVRGKRMIRAIGASLVPTRMIIPLRDRLVRHDQAKPPLEPEAREFLRSIYRDDIIKLQGLINRDLSGWLA